MCFSSSAGDFIKEKKCISLLAGIGSSPLNSLAGPNT